jgi:Kef-type K+ transport system membrane component KefB
MTLTSGQTAHLLITMVLLLAAAHVVGLAFAHAHFPRVIGEIVGGLLLGPTLLGAILPHVYETLFPKAGVTPTVLGALYQLGLILLMFAAGAELGSIFRTGERRTAAMITVTGVLIPFLAGILLSQLFTLSYFEGSAHSSRALSLVFAAGIAVTSIPVISRIMIDLDIVDTPFARIVLNTALIEDIILYAILAIAVGVAESGGGDYGLPRVLGIDSTSTAGAGYYAAATVLVIVLALAIRPLIPRMRLDPSPLSFMAPQLLTTFSISAACVLLGVTLIFGGLVAGIMVGSLNDEASLQARSSISKFAFAYFIPIYFAIVGLRLDLSGFDLPLFVAFLAFACAVKACGVYAGARMAGEAKSTSQNLAVAMNARGGPGIVLASVAFDAHIINQRFYAYLVVLSIVTSLIAGLWLERVLRMGAPLRSVRASAAVQPISVLTAIPSKQVD